MAGDIRETPVHEHRRIGCCWALFAMLVVVGTMSLPVMILLAGVVLLEKRWAHGVGLSRFVAFGCVAAAELVVVEPTLVPGLVTPHSQRMEM